MSIFFTSATSHLKFHSCKFEKLNVQNSTPPKLEVFIFLSNLSNNFLFELEVVLTVLSLLIRILKFDLKANMTSMLL